MFMFYVYSIYILFAFWLDSIFIICVSCVTLCYFHIVLFWNAKCYIIYNAVQLFLNSTYIWYIVYYYIYDIVLINQYKWVLYFTVFIFIYTHDIQYIYWSFTLYNCIFYSTTLQFGKKPIIITRTIFPIQRYRRLAKSRQTEDSLTGWVPGKRSSVPCYATQKEALKAYLQVMRRNKEEREQAEKRKEQHRTQNEEGVWVPVKLEDLFMWLSFFGKNVLLVFEGWKGFFPSDSGTSQFLGCCKFTLE